MTVNNQHAKLIKDLKSDLENAFTSLQENQALISITDEDKILIQFTSSAQNSISKIITQNNLNDIDDFINSVYKNLELENSDVKLDQEIMMYFVTMNYKINPKLSQYVEFTKKVIEYDTLEGTYEEIVFVKLDDNFKKINKLKTLIEKTKETPSSIFEALEYKIFFNFSKNTQGSTIKYNISEVKTKINELEDCNIFEISDEIFEVDDGIDIKELIEYLNNYEQFEYSKENNKRKLNLKK